MGRNGRVGCVKLRCKRGGGGTNGLEPAFYFGQYLSNVYDEKEEVKKSIVENLKKSVLKLS